MPYLGNSPQNNIRQRYYYTATGGQTLFTGADDNGTVLKYQDSKYLDVYLNGVLLQDTIDYTALTKSSVTLLSGATAGDLVEIVAYGVFSVADTVSASLGGTFAGNVSFAANSFVFGNFGIGTNSPGLSATANRKYLTLKGSGTSSGDGCGILQFTSNTPHSIVTTLGNVEWNVFDNSGSSSTRVAYMTASRSGSAANNVGSYLAFATKSDGVSGAGTERMRIDANGNIGFGVVPNSWSISSGITALQIKGASLYSSTRELGALSNAYYNAGWNYIDSAAASQYLQSSGEHYWYTAASGTAGNAITFIERMRITSDGNVGIGGTSDAARLGVRISNGGLVLNLTGNTGVYQRLGTDTSSLYMVHNGLTDTFIYTQESSALRFGTAATERMRISSAGDVGIGATPTARLSVNDSARPKIDLQVNGTQRAFFEYIDASSVTVIDSDGGLSLATNNGERIRIDTTGSYNHYATQANFYPGTSTNYEFCNRSASGGLDFYVNSAGTLASRITSSGRFLISTTNVDPVASNARGTAIINGVLVTTADNDIGIYLNRKSTDGILVAFHQDATLEGSISVSGTTVTYGSFSGSHWSQLADNSRPDITVGTVVESIDEKCEWPDQENEQLAKFKVSDTPASERVYGVFMSWDNDDQENNDAYITGVGAYLIRIAAGQTVSGGKLLESNGDGCARVQSDNIIRSSTIGKVTSNIPTHIYEDGSYTVPCVLYCG